MKSTTKIPRGIRNNNPLNIKVGNSWKGEVEVPTDSVFEQFTEMRWGCRAAFILLRRYINRYKLNTIQLIVERWAPSNENHTKRYINIVSQRTGFPSDMPLKYENVAQMYLLLQAMCYVENGQEISYNDIQEGYVLAK